MRLLIGVSLLALVVALPAQADTIEVKPGQSISAALKKAKPGDTVAVKAGTYHETIHATVSGVKLVSVDGKGAAHIVSSGTPLSLQGGANNTVQGFVLTAGPGGYGIHVGGGKGYVIADNVITGTPLDGINVDQASGVILTDNVIENPQHGKPVLTSHDDIPKVALPDNTAANAEYKKQISNMGGAKKALAKATATKLPSMSMAELRQQIAAKNTAKCN